jgi:uncharacterized membrane protein
MKKTQILIFLIILCSFATSLLAYPQMPENIASHWNLYGQPDGYMPKSAGTFLLPLVSLFLFVLFLILQKIFPLKENIEKFRKEFDYFMIILFLFFFYLNNLSIMWNLGLSFSFIRFIVPAFALLWYFCGEVLEKSKRNWFFGIRTPWTLSSDAVWDKTHKLGGMLFKISGIISLLGMIFINWAFVLVIASISVSGIVTVVHSYFLYKEQK